MTSSLKRLAAIVSTMNSTAIDPEAAVEVAKSAAGILPEEGKAAVLEHLVSDMTPEALKALSRVAKQKFLQALGGTEAAPSATTSPAVSEIKSVDGHQAVVGKMTVQGQQLDTLLSEGSIYKSREDQIAYAKRLGYRMATREENRAYVDSLLAKEQDNSINAAEAKALKTYRDRYVRDTKGGLDVDGRRVRARDSSWFGYVNLLSGALFVRASSESK
jgi:hypothetical protein